MPTLTYNGRTVRFKVHEPAAIRRSLRRYEEGASHLDAGAPDGIPEGTMWRYANAAGIARSRSEAAKESAPTKRDQLPRIARLYQMGRTVPEVVKDADVDVSEDTARKYLRERGLIRDHKEVLRLRHHDPRRPEVRDRIQRIREACRRHAAGEAQASIAPDFDVSQKTISNWWRGPHNPYRRRDAA